MAQRRLDDFRFFPTEPIVQKSCKYFCSIVVFKCDEKSKKKDIYDLTYIEEKNLGISKSRVFYSLFNY